MLGPLQVVSEHSYPAERRLCIPESKMVENIGLKELSDTQVRHTEDINMISQSWPDTARILSELKVAVDSLLQKYDEWTLLFSQLIKEKETDSPEVLSMSNDRSSSFSDIRGQENPVIECTKEPVHTTTLLKENAGNENNTSFLLLGENKLTSGEGNLSKQGNDNLSMQANVQGDGRDLSACEKDNELVPLVSHLMKGKMSHKMSEADKKIACDAKLCGLWDEYTQDLIVAADNVGSNQLQNLRSGLRGDSVVLIEKNTTMKRTVRIHAEKTGNNVILNLIPLLVSNAGLIFTKGDLKEVGEEVAKCKVETPARVGLVADHIRTILCAVAASNIIRNFSFMAENEIVRGQNRHCLEIIFQCLEDYVTEDEELVTNARETIMNLGPLIDLRIFSSSKPSYLKMSEKRTVQAILGMLGSAVKAWHCAAAELLGHLILNPDNEPFLEPFAPQIYRRLVDIMSFPAYDAQATAIGALYNLVEGNMDCRLKLASERWAVDRQLKVSKSSSS